MQTTIQKWGNSYAVRIPKPLVEQLGVRAGGRVRLEIQPKVIRVSQAKTDKRVTLQDWRDYVIPTGRKGKRHISDRIDEILYGKPRR